MLDVSYEIILAFWYFAGEFCSVCAARLVRSLAQFMQIKLQYFILFFLSILFGSFMSPEKKKTAAAATHMAVVHAYKIINLTLINYAHKKCLNGNLSTPKVTRSFFIYVFSFSVLPSLYLLAKDSFGQNSFANSTRTCTVATKIRATAAVT